MLSSNPFLTVWLVSLITNVLTLPVETSNMEVNSFRDNPLDIPFIFKRKKIEYKYTVNRKISSDASNSLKNPPKFSETTVYSLLGTIGPSTASLTSAQLDDAKIRFINSLTPYENSHSELVNAAVVLNGDSASSKTFLDVLFNKYFGLGNSMLITDEKKSFSSSVVMSSVSVAYIKDLWNQALKAETSTAASSAVTVSAATSQPSMDILSVSSGNGVTGNTLLRSSLWKSVLGVLLLYI